MLSNKDFYNIIDKTPLVAFDMLIKYKGKYLFGERVNEPAKGYLFNPGGRILKMETIAEACKRLTKTELGIELQLNRFTFHMNTEHLYENNVFNNNTCTHYVCMCYLCELTDDEYANINISNQHSGAEWFSRDDVLTNKQIHKNAKRYFD